MASHFLLSAKARTLSLVQVARLSDDQAHATFKALRWHETGGDPTCPECGCCAVYEYQTRRLFKCKGCGKQFSVTSGTTFHGRKLAIRDYLMAIAIFANAAKGTSALQLGRDLDVSYKTAFVLAHKLREAMGGRSSEVPATWPCRDRRRLLRRPPQAGQLQGQPGRPPPSRASDRQAQGRGRHARAAGPHAAVRGQGRG